MDYRVQGETCVRTNCVGDGVVPGELRDWELSSEFLLPL